MSEFFAGVDIGATGSLVVIDANHDIYRMAPFTTWQEAYKILADPYFHENIVVAVEMPLCFAGKAVLAMASLNKSFGGWTALLDILGHQHFGVAARTWQREILGQVAKGQSKVAALAWVKAHYTDDLPMLTKRSKKVHDGCVDALCLANYCLRTIRQNN